MSHRESNLLSWKKLKGFKVKDCGNRGATGERARVYSACYKEQLILQKGRKPDEFVALIQFNQFKAPFPTK